ncbi:sulfur carrier protein ThiS [Saccharopolyspora gloriosae]|uniref:sulfur carrier protein ThiS n=1 Tax=Saccharopolyspora gloriosae TaxID=455344 RepID=UPI001FB7A386|nr:sulfur carrier protein ThiS [Saccharopolyspora gloriosae]
MQVVINGSARPVDVDATLATALAEFGVAEQGVAVAVDGTVVPRASWTATELRDGAAIEVLTAVQGG